MVRKEKDSVKLKTNTNFLSRPEFWAVLTLVITVFLRLPTLFEPHRYADEEIYLTLGQAFRQGLVFYRDIHDNKPPLLYLVAALAGSVAWFRFLLMVWHGINVAAFWYLTKSLLGKTRLWVTGLTTLLFAILTTLPLTEGNIANGENFMIMPATVGAYLLWRYHKQKNPGIYLLAGFLFAVAFLFKVPIIFDFMGIYLFLFLLAPPTLEEKLGFLISPATWLLTLGFTGPILVSIAYYASLGAFEPYVKAALLQNISYLSSWGKAAAASSPIWQSGLFQRGVVLGLLTLTILCFKKQLRLPLAFTSIWFVFSLFGALVSGRPYPHYLLEPLVPFSLLIGLFLSEKLLLRKVPILLIALLLLLSAWYYHFWYYKSLPYYRNFWEFISGQKSKSEYFSFFEGVNRNYQVAEYVISHTVSDDRIFVWGTEPAIYALSRRLPVGRYTVSYHIADFAAWQETLKVLSREKPQLIIYMTNEPKSFPELVAFLNNEYLPVKTIDKAVIYQKLY